MAPCICKVLIFKEWCNAHAATCIMLNRKPLIYIGGVFWGGDALGGETQGVAATAYIHRDINLHFFSVRVKRFSDGRCADQAREVEEVWRVGCAAERGTDVACVGRTNNQGRIV